MDASITQSPRSNGQPGGVLQASILMVDDRPANVLALEAILKPLGHHLVAAASGEEALKRLLDKDYAVILMDVQMPGMDGYQTVEMIKQRERCRRVPIIFITAIYKDPEHILRGYAHGAVDYLLKPFDPYVLRSKVSVFVDLFLKEQQLKREEGALRERERELEARRREERFRNLTESVPLCVWAAKADGNIHYANKAWLDYSGMSVEQAGTLGGLAAVHPDQRRPARAAWLESVRSAKPFAMEVALRRQSDGAYRWHLVRAAPERDEGGAITGWIGIATDIDDQKRAAETRARMLAAEQHAREVAEAANRGKDEFLATVSHELRNPLNAIVGWARMLRSGVLDRSGGERALEAIERNAQVQTKLVEDILDVSRIIAGKLRLHARPTSLSAVVSASLDTVRPAAQAKEIQLEVALDPSADAVSGDSDRLQQVVWNLLSNAIKFTPRHGKVEVQLHRAGSEAEVRIRDSGAGMKADFLPHVFDRFRQADSTSTRSHGGLGLGLAIVRHLIELHGGTVGAESGGEGKGSTFTFRLPIRTMAFDPSDRLLSRRGPAQAPSFDGLPSLSGLRVLFVDDQLDARELVTELLQVYGAEVIAVESVASALKALQSNSPDVLVSDIGMPREDGYDLIRKVRALGEENGGSIPALAVTGFAGVEDNRRALAEGFQKYLAKPIDPAELVSLVAQLAGRAGGGDAAPED
ncbi:MAG TPA: response regulator [Myxococcaceae bacterium]|nr:response regulator [Myxococcaceae bacterium]